jgi:hypothetical protein
MAFMVKPVRPRVALVVCGLFDMMVRVFVWDGPHVRSRRLAAGVPQPLSTYRATPRQGNPSRYNACCLPLRCLKLNTKAVACAINDSLPALSGIALFNCQPSPRCCPDLQGANGRRIGRISPTSSSKKVLVCGRFFPALLFFLSPAPAAPNLQFHLCNLQFR